MRCAYAHLYCINKITDNNNNSSNRRIVGDNFCNCAALKNAATVRAAVSFSVAAVCIAAVDRGQIRVHM